MVVLRILAFLNAIVQRQHMVMSIIGMVPNVFLLVHMVIHVQALDQLLIICVKILLEDSLVILLCYAIATTVSLTEQCVFSVKTDGSTLMEIAML